MNNISIVYGPPGCGKTEYINQEVQKASELYGNDKIMVLSLTRAGAQQAARQVTTEGAKIGTIHSHIYHAVGTPTIAEGHIKEWNEAYPDLSLSQNKSIDDPYDTDPRFLLELSRLRTMDCDKALWPHSIRSFEQKWTDWKHQCGYIDFTDLLYAGLDLDTAPGDPSIIACDESQDFGKIEMQILRKWGIQAAELLLVGDFHQCLYNFRGSDPYNMIIDGVTPHILSQSYRIPRAVHTVAMRWMKRTGLPQVHYNPRNADGIVTYGTVTYKEAGTELGFIKNVRTYIDAEKSVMLMASCQYMLAPVLKALQEHGMAYHNPWRPTNGRWNPLAPKKGSTFAEKVLMFLRPSDNVWGDDARFWSVSDMKSWAKALPVRDVFQPGGKVGIERCAESLTDEVLARSMQEWFTPGALEHILNCDNEWYMDKAKGGEISKPFVQTIVKNFGFTALRAEPRIIVGTIHSLKGSEADVCMLWPDIAPAAYYSETDNSAEIARMFYVGVTRAREELVLMPPVSNICVSW